MKRRRRIVAPVYIKLGKKIRRLSSRKTIILWSENKGVLLDGRVVVKREGKWIYRPY